MTKHLNRFNEPDGVMAGKEIKVVPHVPFYKQNGGVVEKEWREDFTDRMGNKAILTKIIYREKEKKGKPGKLNECVIRVKWCN